MTNVDFLIGNLNIEHGGAQQLLYDISVHLPRKFDLTIHYMFGRGTFAPKFREEGVTVNALEADGNFDVRAWWSFVHTLKDRQTDILQTNSPISGLWGRTAGTIAGVQNIVSVEHSVRDGYPRNAQLANGLTLPLADDIVGVSQPVIDSLFQWERALTTRSSLHTIPNGVDVDGIQHRMSKPCADQEIADELAGADFVLGTIGRLVDAKGYETAINALPHLLDKYPETKYLIIGDGPLRNDLSELAKSVDVRDAVLFAGEQSNPHAYLEYVDIGLYPSRWEGFGLAVAETMAAELPVVVSDIPAFERMVGDAGLVVGVDKPTEVSDAVSDLLADPEQRRQVGRAEKDHIVEQYSIRRVAEQYAGLYRQLQS